MAEWVARERLRAEDHLLGRVLRHLRAQPAGRQRAVGPHPFLRFLVLRGEGIADALEVGGGGKLCPPFACTPAASLRWLTQGVVLWLGRITLDQ